MQRNRPRRANAAISPRPMAAVLAVMVVSATLAFAVVLSEVAR